MTRNVLRYMTFAMLALALAGSSSADELGISIGDDIARGMYGHRLEKAEIDLIGSWDHHDDDGDIVALGLLVPGVVGQGAGTVELSLGGKALYADAFSDDGFALALGAEIWYGIPRVKNLSIGATLYYAPDVTAAGDIDAYTEFSVGGGYGLGARSAVTLAFRRVDVDLKGVSEPSFDDGLHLGFRFRF